MKIERKSQLTGDIHTMEIGVTIEQMDRFENRFLTGEYVQNIFSNIPAPQREFILTGITPDEWSKYFSKEEDYC